MKKHASTILLVLVFFVGISILLYPSVSDWWNRRVQTRAIAGYQEALAGMDAADFTAEFAAADEYNQKLAALEHPYQDCEEISGYWDILNTTGTGILGYLSVPRIRVQLPVYHGTSEGVLQVAAGHLEGSSLPVGGAGTHAVISAHRGLPSARLFTDLDQLTEGDTFVIRVLDRELTYEVDQIRIVLPSETDALAIVPGEDYCTLLTCTPYGINTHRLLVRGHRIANADKEHRVTVSNDAVELDPAFLAPLAAVPMLLVLLIVLLRKH